MIILCLYRVEFSQVKPKIKRTKFNIEATKMTIKINFLIFFVVNLSKKSVCLIINLV